MKPRHQVSRAALSLVKSFEGCRRSAARLADGRWTIGYGHTLTAREGAEVSESDAEALLIYDLMNAGALVCDLTFTPLSQNQFDALAAFAFGIGAESFRDSAVVRLVNQGAMLEAAQAMEAWRKSDIADESVVVDGLIRRRAAERMLFLTPPGGFVATPAAVVAPRLDKGAAFARPVEVTVALEGPLAVAERSADQNQARDPEISGPAEPPPEEAMESTLREAAEASAPALAEPADPLYRIPDYDPAASHEPQRKSLTMNQLFVIFGAGILLLVVCFGLLIRAGGSPGSGVLAVAASTGLAGTLAVFSSFQMFLNRIDRDD